MKAPSLDDEIVKVRAYLTDESFGYDHWRAAQFSAPPGAEPKYAALVIFNSEAERDGFVKAQRWTREAEREDDDRAFGVHIREAINAFKGGKE